MRELVQEPMNTRSTGMSTMGVPAFRPMYMQRALGGFLIVDIRERAADRARGR